MPLNFPERPRARYAYDDIYERQYLYDRQFYMAFLPSLISYESTILRCLDCLYPCPHERRISPQGVRYWRFHEVWLKEWDTLWELIQNLEEFLKYFCGFMAPLGLEEPGDPTSHGYRRWHSSYSTLSAALRSARSVFVRHLALIAYLIFRCSPRGEFSLYPQWARKALDQKVIKPHEYSDLIGTWVFNTSHPRRGGVVEIYRGAKYSESAYSTVWFEELPRILVYAPQVPFWFIYHSDPLPPAPSKDVDPWLVAREFLPEQLKTPYRSYPSQQVESSWGVSDPWPTHPLQHSTEANANANEGAQKRQPPCWRSCKNLPEFRAKLTEYFEYRASVDDAATTAKYMEKLEEYNTKYALSGPPQGARWMVHVWEEQLDGTWTSQVHTHKWSKVVELWQTTTNTHRFYDPYSNRYHVGKALEDVPTQRELEELEDEEEDDIYAGCVWPVGGEGMLLLLMNRVPGLHYLLLAMEFPQNDGGPSLEGIHAAEASQMTAFVSGASEAAVGPGLMGATQDSQSNSMTAAANVVSLPSLGGRNDSASLVSNDPMNMDREQSSTAPIGADVGEQGAKNTRGLHNADIQEEVLNTQKPISAAPSHPAASIQIVGPFGQMPRIASNQTEVRGSAPTERELNATNQTVLQRFGHITIPIQLPAALHQDRKLFPEAWSEIGPCRYGLVVPASLTESGHTTPPKLTPVPKLHVILGAHPDRDPIPSEWLNTAQYVFSYVAVSKTPPVAVLDFLPMVHDHPLAQARPCIVRRVQPMMYLVDVGSTEKYSVNWTFLFDSALTVLHVLRMHIEDQEALASRLKCLGIKFHTVMQTTRPAKEVPYLLHCGLGLGIHPSEYKPNALDYRVYEFRRNQVLRGPRGTAALRMGGIVWRLAYECLGDEFVIGPSNDRTHEFSLIYDDKYLVDDGLSQEELDIICGVYHIHNRMFLLQILVSYLSGICSCVSTL